MINEFDLSSNLVYIISMCSPSKMKPRKKHPPDRGATEKNKKQLLPSGNLTVCY